MLDRAPAPGTGARGLRRSVAAVNAGFARSRKIFAGVGTLRVRLTVAVAVLSAAGLAAGGALLVRAVETTVVRAIEDQSRAELHVIGGQLAHGVPLDAIRAAPGRRLRFMRADGSPVESRRFDDLDPAMPPPPPTRTGPGLGPGHPPPDHAWSVVEMPLMSTREGPIQAIAWSPLEDVLRSTRTLQHVLVIGIPALAALLTLAAWMLIGRALRPVRVMTQCAAGIADATAPDRLAVPPTRDELGELACTLNRMLDRLAEAARRQREFVSDASHELRSPIAATRAQLEVALAHPDRTDGPAVLRGVLAETTRLEVLVADLLALARLDETPALPYVEIDLDDIVLDEATRTRAVAIDTRSVTAVKVRGEHKGLGHLVRNLLDNAARHAASRVEVSTCLDDGAPMLVVDDDGPGIPDADRARVFERFTRLSSSRSRDDGGAGLGLALVRRIAEQHGGTVRADRSPLGGARLEVRFPRDC